jgi:hypothetical protein
VQAWAAAIQNNGVVQALLMGDLAVASGRQKTLTVGFGADPQATAMSSKDGCGEEVLGVVAAEYTRFDRLLTEVTSGGTKLAILHLIGRQSDPRGDPQGHRFLRHLVPTQPGRSQRHTGDLRNRRTLGGASARGPYAVRARLSLVDVAEYSLWGGEVPIRLVKTGYRADDQDPVLSGRRMSNGSPAKCGNGDRRTVGIH